MFSRQNLFWKTLVTITVISLGYLIFAVGVLAWYMIVPLGQRASDDLANIMTHAAEQWVLLETDNRSKFSNELLAKHQLVITQADQPLAKSTSLLPYLYFLKQAIEKHQRSETQLKQSRDNKGVDWFWADISIDNQSVRIGFKHSRIGVQPPLALIIVLLAGLLLTLITTVVLTRRLTIPVERLYQAAHNLGKGHWPDPIKEEGPEELKALSRTFNRMNRQVKELLANRTTLLSGIAHDLRTPLTQIQLALEMLPEDGGDLELMTSIKQDLDKINHLISESLSIGAELAEEDKESVNISQELAHIVNYFQQNQDRVIIKYSQNKTCLIHIQTLSLHRIINNLLENAIRYSNGNDVDVDYQCTSNNIIITIKDRGSGIPEEHMEAIFQPFFRLEQSRNSGTGGSGLGLAIVRQLSDSHGWSVKLEARLDGGTVASLTLPCD